MKWASVASVEPGIEAAASEAVSGICRELGRRDPDLVVVFVSEHHAAAYDRVPELIGGQMDPGVLIGCSAGGVIGGGREIEQRPALSITAAILPDVELAPFHVDSSRMPQAQAGLAAWEQFLGVPGKEEAHFVLLPDPFTFEAEPFVSRLDRIFPGSRKVGGLASGGRQPGENALFFGEDVYRFGMVGVACSGNIEIDTIVAQGCRPIGLPMFVTQCREHVLLALDGRRPVEVLQELYAKLDPRDQELFRHSLFVGLVMNELRQEYRQGDFLIRNVVGMDPDSGAMAIGAHLHEGTVVQFHLRDARTSAEDLEELLERYRRESQSAPAEGSLLFSCLGRGALLYGRADHDSEAFRRHLGEIPLGGFFCNGEIGPVHGKTFLHGYTSSFGLFRARLRLAS